MARNFTASSGVADMNCVFEIKRGHQVRDIGRIGVHVVAGIGLARATVPAPVVRNDAITLREKEQHLAVPLIARERPPVMKDDRLRVLVAPRLEEDLRAVLGSNRRHVATSPKYKCRRPSFPQHPRCPIAYYAAPSTLIGISEVQS